MQNDIPGDNSYPRGSGSRPHSPEETEWHGFQAGNFPSSRGSLINGCDVTFLARFALDLEHSAWVSKEFCFALVVVCMQLYEPQLMHLPSPCFWRTALHSCLVFTNMYWHGAISPNFNFAGLFRHQCFIALRSHISLEPETLQFLRKSRRSRVSFAVFRGLMWKKNILKWNLLVECRIVIKSVLKAS